MLFNHPAVRGVIVRDLKFNSQQTLDAFKKVHTVYHDLIKTYFEFPSIWMYPGPSAWNWNFIFNVSTVDAALESYKLDNMPINKGKLYFSICYVELMAD